MFALPIFGGLQSPLNRNKSNQIFKKKFLKTDKVSFGRQKFILKNLVKTKFIKIVNI